jgi:choice-of-anchor A domain-containing protein
VYKNAPAGWTTDAWVSDAFCTTLRCHTKTLRGRQITGQRTCTARSATQLQVHLVWANSTPKTAVICRFAKWIPPAVSGKTSHNFRFSLWSQKCISNCNEYQVHPIDIQAPAGSTIIVNVTGTNLALGTGIYYNENQNSGDSSLNDNILFNFADAQTVTINGQFNASLLAPFAVLTGSAQMGGNFIAAAIGQTGEVHNDEFTGTLPPPPTTSQAPEPGSFVLMGSGLVALAGAMRRRFIP